MSLRLCLETPREIGLCSMLSSMLEAWASPKPGNVHRFSDPRDHGKTFEQFMIAASLMGPVYEACARDGYDLSRQSLTIGKDLHIGFRMKEAIDAMLRGQDGGNLLLGHVLLLMPLAASAGYVLGMGGDATTMGNMRTQVMDVTRSGNTNDVIAMYEGIRACNPGGMGTVDELDVMSSHFKEELLVRQATFQDAFAGSAGLDSISSEWISGFAITFEKAYPLLVDFLNEQMDLNDAIVQLFLELLSIRPDSLIARKNNIKRARDVSNKARVIINAGGIKTQDGRRLIRAFDAELAAAGGLLNPGTTADLCAAAIFLLLATHRKIFNEKSGEFVTC